MLVQRNKKGFETNFLKISLKHMVREMLGRENVWSRKCLNGEMSGRGNIYSGKYVREVPSREVSVWDLSSRKCHSGICPVIYITDNYIIIDKYDNLDLITHENNKIHKPNWLKTPDHSQQILLIGGSGSRNIFYS